jgi:hypothetical protein
MSLTGAVATVPALRPGVSGAEGGGRGLYLVDSLAARWGFEQDGADTTTWFELRHRRPLSHTIRGARFWEFRSVSLSYFLSVFRLRSEWLSTAEVPGTCAGGHAGGLPDLIQEACKNNHRTPGGRKTCPWQAASMLVMRGLRPGCVRLARALGGQLVCHVTCPGPVMPWPRGRFCGEQAGTGGRTRKGARAVAERFL